MKCRVGQLLEFRPGTRSGTMYPWSWSAAPNGPPCLPAEAGTPTAFHFFRTLLRVQASQRLAEHVAAFTQGIVRYAKRRGNLHAAAADAHRRKHQQPSTETAIDDLPRQVIIRLLRARFDDQQAADQPFGRRE